MPKINHRRKNRTDGARSGGGTTHGCWTKRAGTSFRVPRKAAWRRVRQFERWCIKVGLWSQCPPRPTKRCFWSEPGFNTPNIPRVHARIQVEQDNE